MQYSVADVMLAAALLCQSGSLEMMQSIQSPPQWCALTTVQTAIWLCPSRKKYNVDNWQRLTMISKQAYFNSMIWSDVGREVKPGTFLPKSTILTMPSVESSLTFCQRTASPFNSETSCWMEKHARANQQRRINMVARNAKCAPTKLFKQSIPATAWAYSMKWHQPSATTDMVTVLREQVICQPLCHSQRPWRKYPHAPCWSAKATAPPP